MSRSLIPALFKRADPPIEISEEGRPFTIEIEIRTKDHSPRQVYAVLDTGCPVDLVSLWFARKHLLKRGEDGKDKGEGDKGKGVEGEEDEDEKRREIDGVKVPGAKLISSGEWCVRLKTRCSLGETIRFKSVCAGIERDPRLPPVVIGMATLKAQQFLLVPRLQAWWRPCRPPLTIGKRPEAVPSDLFAPENSFFDGKERMPLRVIFDTGTVMDGVCIKFAKKHLRKVTAPECTWIDVEGEEQTCEGLWELPLCLTSKDDKQRSFSVLCWGMDLGEPYSGGHHSVRLSKTTLAEQNIHLDCGPLSFTFEKTTAQTLKNWGKKVIDGTKSLNHKLREHKMPKTDEK
ncbi:unnamed protein product [Clonostachys byssicola]|uniref:Uncharacterized protein n=1 Tax=Clonostachys byssicola TaxID=160290 RepID=A0A9N9XYY4_9HYPO|nr:unnamed protein product [Clonostachys byssicola]